MGLNIFWDNSNIWLVGRGVCESKEPGYENDFRIHFEKLFDFVVDNRSVDFAYLSGSIPPQNDGLWRRFDDLGIIVEKQERGIASGGEIAVDEIIQLSMANRILDSDIPGTMVLLTGDGNGYDQGKGFIMQLERAKKYGWEIEVVSWDHGCSRQLREFAIANGTYRSLEPVYSEITFINNKRWAL